ncbi:MAG: MATE family efflux transporter [Deltaproteobacteria bacterium]|nr:MATE family efflux transporter [Deltaproteobacteria bacterium]
MDKPRYQTILDLALPIMGGMVSQNIMNLVDTAMVGSLGKAALAAVGMSSFAAFMSQAFIMGLSSGVQAMAARRLGAGRNAVMAVPLNGGLAIAIALGVPLTVVLFLVAPALYPYLNSDPDVIADGVPYLQARLCAITAVGMNFAFRGYFNGVSLSRVYLRSLLVMHGCNVVLNYGLIFGHFGLPELGALGAGIGTAISTYVGTITYCVMALRYARGAGFLRGLPDRQTFRTMLALSVPSGIRQLFFAAGLTALFWIVGRVSTASLAAANVVVNLMLVAILPGMGLGMAAASLVGQALGRRDKPDAKQWGWDVVKAAVVVLGVVGLPMLVIPDLLLGVFIHDPATLEVGRLPLQIVGATIALDGVGLVLQNAMLGAGDSRRVMVVAIVLQWVLFLPVAYGVGPVMGGGLLAIWLAQSAYRAIQAGCYAAMWHRGRWAQIQV